MKFQISMLLNFIGLIIAFFQNGEFPRLYSLYEL